MLGFFRFGRKVEAAKEFSLEEIPLFSSLTASEQRLIEKKGRLVEFKRGDLVYEEGAPSEAFYVVISGRFRVFAKSRNDSNGETLFFLYRGDHFGEISLLTGKHHSASVEAKSDGLVFKLEKEDFHRLVEEIPAISLHLSRSLGHRITRSDEHKGHSREVKINALYASAQELDAFRFWLDLSESLSHETNRKVIVVDFTPELYPYYKETFKVEAIPGFKLGEADPASESDVKACLIQHPSGFFYLHVPFIEGEVKNEKKISALLTFLTYRYDYLMLRLTRDMNDMVFQALKQSDMVYVYAIPGSTNLTECAVTIGEFQKTFGFSKNEIRVIIPEDSDPFEVTFEEKERLLDHRIFAMLPAKTDAPERYQSTIRFLTRELAETLVGLALGSGAAFGLAHIGVLRVLEEENIPVDIIAGASIGAVVGALWASGFRAAELEGIAHSVRDKRVAFFKLLGFQDVSIAHRGFFKGNQVTKYLETYLGNKTFHELKIPVKIIASNLLTSEEVVLEAGRVIDAIRASISIPGILRPFQYKDQYLIDGGVIDPLPVRVLADLGVKKIIGVNVLSGPKDRVERNRLREKKKWSELKDMAKENVFKRMISQFLYKTSERSASNIFNVIMNTIQFMEFEIARMSGDEADVLIHPVVLDGHWAEFYSPEKFIKAGEESTRNALPEIKRLLAE